MHQLSFCVVRGRQGSLVTPFSARLESPSDLRPKIPDADQPSPAKLTGYYSTRNYAGSCFCA
jgi:hypothetical protein